MTSLDLRIQQLLIVLQLLYSCGCTLAKSLRIPTLQSRGSPQIQMSDASYLCVFTAAALSTHISCTVMVVMVAPKLLLNQVICILEPYSHCKCTDKEGYKWWSSHCKDMFYPRFIQYKMTVKCFIVFVLSTFFCTFASQSMSFVDPGKFKSYF